MRIGIDGLPLSETLAGVGHYTWELAWHLGNNSHSDQVEVVSPRPFLDSIRLPAQNDSRLQLTRSKVNPITRHWWLAGLPRLIKRHQIEVFHGTNFEVPLQRVCPSVLTIHDLSLLLYPETHERRRVWRARHRLPLMARRATMIITVSEAVRREVHQYLRLPLDKIVTVPSAARASFHRMEPAKAAQIRKELGIEDGFVLYAGTMEPRKNLSLLVQAFGELSQREKRPLQLVMAGKKGWMVDELFVLLKQAAKEKIVVTGYLDDEQLCALYSSCSLFVYPSVYEGFGLPPLEAMACGAPVIASRIPSIEEVAGAGAWLVSPRSLKELTEAMSRLLQDNALRQKLIAAGQKRAREFSWSSTADLTREVYREAIDRFKRQRKKQLA